MKSLSYLFTISLLLSASPLMAMDPPMDPAARDHDRSAPAAAKNPYGITPEDFQKTQSFLNWGSFTDLMYANDELKKIQLLHNKNSGVNDPKVDAQQQTIDSLLSHHARNIKDYINNYYNKTPLEAKEMWDNLQIGELLVWRNAQEAAFILETYRSENPKYNIASPQDHFIRTLENTQAIVHREEFKYSQSKGIGFTAQEMKIMSETFDWRLYEELRSALYNGLFLDVDAVINSTHEYASCLLQKQAFNLKLFLNVEKIPNLDLSQKSLLKENLSKKIEEGPKEVQPLLRSIAQKTNPAPQNHFGNRERAEPTKVEAKTILPASQPSRPLPQPRPLPRPVQANYPGNNPFMQPHLLPQPAQAAVQLPPPPQVQAVQAHVAVAQPAAANPQRNPQPAKSQPAKKWGTVQAAKPLGSR